MLTECLCLQSIQRDWRISRAVDEDSSLASGQVTLGLKAVSIGAPAVRVVDSLPEAASIQGDHNSGRPQFETPSPEASQEDLADLLSLANAFEASTLDLSAADSGLPEDTPPKEGDHSAPARAKSAQRVRIDESLNKIDTPKSEARAQDGGVYARLGSPTRQARLGSPTRQARLGSPPRSKGGKGSNAAFKAGGKAALLAANSKFLAAPVSPRKQAARRVDATAVGDRYDLAPCSLLLAPCSLLLAPCSLLLALCSLALSEIQLDFSSCCR